MMSLPVNIAWSLCIRVYMLICFLSYVFDRIFCKKSDLPKSLSIPPYLPLQEVNVSNYWNYTPSYFDLYHYTKQSVYADVVKLSIIDWLFELPRCMCLIDITKQVESDAFRSFMFATFHRSHGQNSNFFLIQLRAYYPAFRPAWNCLGVPRRSSMNALNSNCSKSESWRTPEVIDFQFDRSITIIETFSDRSEGALE